MLSLRTTIACLPILHLQLSSFPASRLFVGVCAWVFLQGLFTPYCNWSLTCRKRWSFWTRCVTKNVVSKPKSLSGLDERKVRTIAHKLQQTHMFSRIRSQTCHHNTQNQRVHCIFMSYVWSWTTHEFTCQTNRAWICISETSQKLDFLVRVHHLFVEWIKQFLSIVHWPD